MSDANTASAALTAGVDVGDRFSYICILESHSGEVVEETRIRTTQVALRSRFATAEPMRIALETGTHSPWISRMLESYGHEVIVADARQLRLISASKQKRDVVDAEQLARLARIDPQLLNPVQHRGADTQADLALLRSRESLVQARTRLINHVRGSVKAMGNRLPTCSADSFHRQVATALPDALRPAVEALLTTIQERTEQIRSYDRAIEACAAQRYPETTTLRQVTGVGALTALAFVLVLEDPARFANGRQVAAYLGLTPASRQSGDADPPQRITKRGDALLRRLLVHSAHYILGPFGPDCDLRRFGQSLATRGGRYAKQRAVVAVARKLAGILSHLWKTGEDYEPFYLSQHRGEPAA